MNHHRAWRVTMWAGLAVAAALIAAELANLRWDFSLYGPGGSHVGWFAGSAQVGVYTLSDARGLLVAPASAPRHPWDWYSIMEELGFWQVAAPSWMLPLPALGLAALAHLRGRPRPEPHAVNGAIPAA